MHDNVPMPFGKHKGEPLADVPADYLDWYIGQDWAREPMKTRVVEHLRGRADWHALDADDEPTAVADDVYVCNKCFGDLSPAGWCKACGTTAK